MVITIRLLIIDREAKNHTLLHSDIKFPNDDLALVAIFSVLRPIFLRGDVRDRFYCIHSK